MMSLSQMHQGAIRPHRGRPPLTAYLNGGSVRGPGTPTSDSVLARLSRKEYVLPADTTAAVGRRRLDALRLATHKPVAGPGYADGGILEPAKNAIKTRQQRLDEAEAQALGTAPPKPAPAPQAQKTAPAPAEPPPKKGLFGWGFMGLRDGGYPNLDEEDPYTKALNAVTPRTLLHIPQGNEDAYTRALNSVTPATLVSAFTRPSAAESNAPTVAQNAAPTIAQRATGPYTEGALGRRDSGAITPAVQPVDYSTTMTPEPTPQAAFVPPLVFSQRAKGYGGPASPSMPSLPASQRLRGYVQPAAPVAQAPKATSLAAATLPSMGAANQDQGETGSTGYQTPAPPTGEVGAPAPEFAGTATGYDQSTRRVMTRNYTPAKLAEYAGTTEPGQMTTEESNRYYGAINAASRAAEQQTRQANLDARNAALQDVGRKAALQGTRDAAEEAFRRAPLKSPERALAFAALAGANRDIAGFQPTASATPNLAAQAAGIQAAGQEAESTGQTAAAGRLSLAQARQMNPLAVQGAQQQLKSGAQAIQLGAAHLSMQQHLADLSQRAATPGPGQREATDMLALYQKAATGKGGPITDEDKLKVYGDMISRASAMGPDAYKQLPNFNEFAASLTPGAKGKTVTKADYDEMVKNAAGGKSAVDAALRNIGATVAG